MKRLVVKAMVVIMLTVVGCSAIGGTRETEAASNKGQKVVNYAKRKQLCTVSQRGNQDLQECKIQKDRRSKKNF